MSELINTVLLPLSLFIIMLGIGLSVKAADFSALKQHKQAVIAGFCLQVITLPLLALLLITIGGVRGEYAVAIMIVACCPGGVTSNAVTFIFSGVVALSVVLTLLSSLVAPLTIPAITQWSLVNFMGESARYEFALGATIAKLFVLSIVPLLLGQVFQRVFPQWCISHCETVRKASGWWFLGLIGLMVVSNGNLLGRVIAELGWFLLLLAISAIAMGYAGARVLGLSKAYRLTLAIEVGIQNAGMGLLITSTILGNQTMTMILIAYGILMQLPIIAFAWWYRDYQALKKKTV